MPSASRESAAGGLEGVGAAFAENQVKFLCGNADILESLLAALVAEGPFGLFPLPDMAPQGSDQKDCNGSQKQASQGQEDARMVSYKAGEGT